LYRLKHSSFLSTLLIVMLLFMSGLTAISADDGSGTGSGDGGGTKPPTLESACLSTISNNTSTTGTSLGSNMKLSTNPPTIRIQFATNVVDDTVWSNNKGCFSMRKSGSSIPITVSRIDNNANFAERRNIFIKPQEALSSGSYTIQVDSGIKSKNGVSAGNSQSVSFSIASSNVEVTAITVKGENNASTVVNGKTLQMSAAVLPGNASDKSVTWSVASGTGSATIGSSGLLKGTKAGTVTVTAKAKDGSGIKGSKVITVTAAEEEVKKVAVTSISVSGKAGASTVVNGKTLQINATVLPSNASDKSVTWSVASGTGSATIGSSGLLKGTKAGTVTVTAKAKDGSGVKGSKVITVTAAAEEKVAVTSITVSGKDNAGTVVNSKTLQMNATVLPVNATDPGVTWSVAPGTGSATIGSSGLLKGTKAGTVTVTAKAKDGSGVKGSKVITVTAAAEDEIAVTSITVRGKDNAGTVVNGKTLQMNATVLPENVTDPGVTWSVTPGTGSATIGSSGLLKGTKAGTVTVTAEANDSSGIKGSEVITVTTEEEVVMVVTAITVSGEGNVSTVVNGESLQMIAEVLPENATDPSVSWSVAPGTGSATIEPATGILTGTAAGTVTVTATDEDSSVYGSIVITVNEPVVPPVIELGDISGCWAVTMIRALIDAGAIAGYPDGSFKPDNNISRAEFAVVLVKAFRLQSDGGEVFRDTAGHWAKDYIATAQALGIVNGYNNGYFGANDLITREQMAVMIVKAAKIEADSSKTTFSDDNEISAWAKSGISTAVAHQIIAGYSDNTFKPKGRATRAEAVTAIFMALK